MKKKKKKRILKDFFMKFLGLDSYSCAVTLKALWIDMVSFEWENKSG